MWKKCFDVVRGEGGWFWKWRQTPIKLSFCKSYEGKQKHSRKLPAKPSFLKEMNRAALTFLQGSKHFSFILRKCLDLLLLQCLCCGLMPSFFTPNFLIKIFMNLLCQKLQETFRRKCLFSWKCSLTSHTRFGPESPAAPRLNGFYIYENLWYLRSEKYK